MPELRRCLLRLLQGKGAHLAFDAVVRDFPAGLRGKRPRGSPHTAWQLLEHMRIAQWDILEFVRDPEHVSPAFPEGHWPSGDAPPDGTAWDRSVAAFRKDLRAVQRLVRDPRRDLLAPLPHTDGVTLMRQALLVADHNAYHLGQMMLLRRMLGG
jgi:hypothetical protein